MCIFSNSMDKWFACFHLLALRIICISKGTESTICIIPKYTQTNKVNDKWEFIDWPPFLLAFEAHIPKVIGKLFIWQKCHMIALEEHY